MSKLSTAKLPVSKVVSFNFIEDAFERGPIDIHRSYSTSSANSKHIGEELWGAQTVFSFVKYEGEYRLLDGYRRVNKVRLHLTAKPDLAVAMIYSLEGGLTIKDLYDQIDTACAHKRITDKFDEGLRGAQIFDTVSSKFVLNGFKSAAKIASGLEGPQSIREGVIASKVGIQFVDKLMLARNTESLGVASAYYAIGSFSDTFGLANCEAFIRGLNANMFDPRVQTSRDSVVMAARGFINLRNTAGTAGGSKNAKNIQDKILGFFLEYAGYRIKGAATLSRFVALAESLAAKKGSRKAITA